MLVPRVAIKHSKIIVKYFTITSNKAIHKIIVQIKKGFFFILYNFKSYKLVVGQAKKEINAGRTSKYRTNSVPKEVFQDNRTQRLKQRTNPYETGHTVTLGR